VVVRSFGCLNQVIKEMTVVWAFDTLGCAKRSREAGVPDPQAEGHAEAAREFIMIELVTKQDLQAAKLELQAAINSLEARLGGRIDILQAAMDTQTLRLTARLGGIVAAGFGILAVAIGTLALFVRLH
jgi:uncharacterized membrane-anchored protein